MLSPLEEGIVGHDSAVSFLVLLLPEFLLVCLKGQHLAFLVLVHEVDSQIIPTLLVEFESPDICGLDCFGGQVLLSFILDKLSKLITCKRFFYMHDLRKLFPCSFASKDFFDFRLDF